MKKIDASWLARDDVQAVLAAFDNAGVALRFVGGCVRDTLLGNPIIDMDAATPAHPEKTIEILENANIRAIPTGLAHGTITALIGEQKIEITTLRKDLITDGRHAEIAFTDDWHEDAKRRDFTMNAMYLSADGTLSDYWGGEDDLRAGRVVFIGEARARIREDFLRILRFFRFTATVGNGTLDEQGLAACAALKEGITQLSGERIQHELIKLLAAPHSAPVLAKMHEVGVLFWVVPLKKPAIDAVARLEEKGASALLKLAALIAVHSELRKTVGHLRLSLKQQKTLSTWLKIAADISPAMSELAQKKIIRAHGHQTYKEAVLLAWASTTSAWKEFTPLLRHIDWPIPPFPVKPADLEAAGIMPGKTMGDTLRKLETIWEEGGYVLTKAELLKMI